jgi:hypothetical protein
LGKKELQNFYGIFQLYFKSLGQGLDVNLKHIICNRTNSVEGEKLLGLSKVEFISLISFALGNILGSLVSEKIIIQSSSKTDPDEAKLSQVIAICLRYQFSTLDQWTNF